ncbi:MAG: hypothetical protein KKE20_04820 [Nanoarchaeota archaeon]|nr:hypothetical protein [Nanoarchaeota archaeon]
MTNSMIFLVIRNLLMIAVFLIPLLVSIYFVLKKKNESSAVKAIFTPALYASIISFAGAFIVSILIFVLVALANDPEAGMGLIIIPISFSIAIAVCIGCLIANILLYLLGYKIFKILAIITSVLSAIILIVILLKAGTVSDYLVDTLECKPPSDQKCYARKAHSSNDPDICLLSQSPGYCYSMYAELSLDETYCREEYSKQAHRTCYGTLARLKRQPELCHHINSSTQFFLENCIETAVIAKNCHDLELASERRECISKFQKLFIYNKTAWIEFNETYSKQLS